MFKPDSNFMQEIDQWIEKNSQAFVKDLDRLVVIPSISVQGDEKYPFGKDCGDVLDEAVSLATGYGFHMENYEYYCGSLLVKGTAEEPKRIGMYAHLDVVLLREGWYNPPLKCALKNGFLIGRGVGDNKGPGICALYVLWYLKEHGTALKDDVLLYFDLSEETGMQDIEYFCRTQQAPDFNLVVDTNFPIYYGEKGLMRASIEREIDGNLVSFHGGSVVSVIPAKAEAVLSGVGLKEAVERLKGIDEISVEQDGADIKVSARGISRHTAFPEGSANTVHVLTGALAKNGLVRGSTEDAMRAVEFMASNYYGVACGTPSEDSESGKLTCVGSAAHGEEGRINVSLGTRYPVTVDGREVAEGFRKQAKSLGFGITTGELSVPAYVPLDNPYIPVLSEICDHIQDRHCESYTMGGGTYSRHLPCATGFGPGALDAPNPLENGYGQRHQLDECIPLQMLLKGLKIYIISLIELDRML